MYHVNDTLFCSNSSTTDRFTEVDATATELVKSFSEDPKKTGIDDFMRELLEFLKRFDRAQRENTARELKVKACALHVQAGTGTIEMKRRRFLFFCVFHVDCTVYMGG